MPVESDIQRDIIAFLRGLDKTYEFNVGGGASTAKGTPDLLVCHRGRFVALEIKRDEETYGVTPTQAINMRRIRKAEGIAESVTSIADVAALLKEV